MRGPLSEVGFWKLSSSESTGWLVSLAFVIEENVTHTVDQWGLPGRSSKVIGIIADVSLALGKFKRFVRFPLQGSLSVELLSSLPGERQSFLCVGSRVAPKVGLVLWWGFGSLDIEV